MEGEEAMKRLAISVIVIGLVCMPILATVHAQDKHGNQNKPVQKATAKPATQMEDEGQKVFEQNCSRCHNAPEGFSPRISGSIVRHMRVRARLSKQDEEKLLRFFNP
jgi:cytochrome c5